LNSKATAPDVLWLIPLADGLVNLFLAVNVFGSHSFLEMNLKNLFDFSPLCNWRCHQPNPFLFAIEMGPDEIWLIFSFGLMNSRASWRHLLPKMFVEASRTPQGLYLEDVFLFGVPCDIVK